MPRFRRFAILAAALGAAACGQVSGAGPLPLDRIKLPPGFRIDLYAHPVPGARSMALGAGGTLFVGTMDKGSVYALVDADKDGRAEEVLALARGLSMPNGVAVRDGALYVAEINRILRYDGIEGQLKSPPAPVVVKGDLPAEKHHGWKFIAFGPDGLLYVPIGAPCNVCDRGDPFASITRMKPDGSGFEIVARGVRNTVGFDWHPGTRELWFTDNGRDMMGDDVPPDELNRLTRTGLHFGFPYCHGGDVPDAEFGRSRPCSSFEPPAGKLDPHVAAIGMRFYTGSMFPPEYRGQIFVAEHGSWNRTNKIGYRVMLVRLKGDQAVSYEPFAQGWLRSGSEWGRPADVLVMPDGALLVSDDAAGAIYRISYKSP
jgi:glucose/arabinose dehydrogenase